jgi:hypothetical protein
MASSVRKRKGRLLLSFFLPLALLVAAACGSNPQLETGAGSRQLGTSRDPSWRRIAFRAPVTFGLYAKPTGGGRVDLEFEGAPAFVHPLKMAPGSVEPELARGRWVCLVYAVWSIPDVESIPIAVDAVKAVDHDIQLGIRPFSEYEEMTNLYPECDKSFESPYWILLEDGKSRGMKHGVLSRDEAIRFCDGLNHAK